jgi:hypothetical protein
VIGACEEVLGASLLDDGAVAHHHQAVGRLGHVIIAGCRDHGAARQLGFVPTHGAGAALTMARGWTERPPRVGFLLSPPYFPLRVGSGSS